MLAPLILIPASVLNLEVDKALAKRTLDRAKTPASPIVDDDTKMLTRRVAHLEQNTFLR